MAVASDKKELSYHLDHDIAITWHGEKENPTSVCVECRTCGVVLYEEDD